jgi:hypothetical protein
MTTPNVDAPTHARRTSRAASAPGTPPRSLDDLARLSGAALEALFREGVAPTSMRAVDGPLIGRMLDVRAVPQALAVPLRRFAASDAFVWEGKTFNASDDAHGVGENRVRLRGVLGRQNLFPFATHFASSAIDGRTSLVLDYDREENPPFIRRIHDEIREVAPGLFLGPAMWKGVRGKSLVLWFALDARRS